MQVYLVGGAIRDLLLGIEIQDRDWVVVGSTPDEMIKKKFLKVGRDFPVFLHPITHEEYALARTERKIGVGYNGFKVNFSSKVTLEEDLMRRDLTINAIAQDNMGNFIDPFLGQLDVKRRVLRHVSSAFSEDPLRVFRVARFAANLFHLGFYIAKDTLVLMKSICIKKEIMTLLPDRIWKEIIKGLKTSNPHIFFMILNQCHALKYVCPEFFYLFQNFRYSLYKKVNFSFRKLVFTELIYISLQTKNAEIRFLYLCQFFSKRHSLGCSSVILRFFDKKSSQIVYSLCKRLKVSTEILKMSVLMCGFYHFLQNIYVQTAEKIVKFFNILDVWRRPKRLKKLIYLKIYENSFFFLKKYPLSLGKFLKKMFQIINKITVQSHSLHRNFKGVQIRKELNRLRVKILKKWLISNI